MHKSLLALAALMLFATPAIALDLDNTYLPELDTTRFRRDVRVPDILGLQTLKCDFHLHTIFSDGLVWPTVRVLEAWMDGLDAIAITDHLEDYPRKTHVGGDDNSAYEIAKGAAAEHNILLVHGAEITRDMPEGHYNALFLSDANALDVEDFMDAVEAAIEQGAFVQWNHPGWKEQQPKHTHWLEVPDILHKKGWLHGIEVFNFRNWYPVALGWCIEKNLTVTGNSDIHGIVREQYDLSETQRPMTLVFCEERSIPALREALFAGRTATWFSRYLAGQAAYLEALFQAAVKAHPPHMRDSRGARRIRVSNASDIPFTLSGAGPWRGSATLPPRGSSIIHVRGDADTTRVRVTNCYVDAEKTLSTTLALPAE